MSCIKKETNIGSILKIAMAVSLAGVVAILVVAVVMRSVDGLCAQLLLTFATLLGSSVLMYIQMWGPPRFSKTRAIGVAVILIWEASFLMLVWTRWKVSNIVWRLWWISAVMSIVFTYVVVLRGGDGRKWRSLRRVTTFFIMWVGLMLVWLGLRANMLESIAPLFLYVGAVAAAGALVSSLCLALCWLRDGTRARSFPKRMLVAGLVVSHLLIGVAAFFIGRRFDSEAYLIQSRVAEYLGDTKIVARAPFITVEEIKSLSARLQPGDIILERRNWYLSNPWLSGFWTHSAIYVGTADDLRKLGIADERAVRKHLDDYLSPAADGGEKVVIEAVSEGVILNSLTDSLHADYVAVLRPRLDDAQKALAIVRAFGNLGKPFDFNFDFNDTSRLVCSQVIYLSYGDMLHFDLKRVFGRTTLPPNEIACKFAAERGLSDHQLDFVLFIDASPSTAGTFEADENAFCASIERPCALVEQ